MSLINDRFRLENRFQDTNWEPIDESYEFCGDAICRASELADHPLMGMVRVVDSETSQVMVTYAAGGGIARLQ